MGTRRSGILLWNLVSPGRVHTHMHMCTHAQMHMHTQTHRGYSYQCHCDPAVASCQWNETETVLYMQSLSEASDLPPPLLRVHAYSGTHKCIHMLACVWMVRIILYHSFTWLVEAGSLSQYQRMLLMVNLISHLVPCPPRLYLFFEDPNSSPHAHAQQLL